MGTAIWVSELQGTSKVAYLKIYGSTGWTDVADQYWTSNMIESVKKDLRTSTNYPIYNGGNLTVLQTSSGTVLTATSSGVETDPIFTNWIATNVASASSSTFEEQTITYKNGLGGAGATQSVTFATNGVYFAVLTNSVTMNLVDYPKTNVQVSAFLYLKHDATMNTYTCSWANARSPNGARYSLANSTNSLECFILRWSGWGTNGPSDPSGKWMIVDHMSPMLDVVN